MTTRPTPDRMIGLLSAGQYKFELVGEPRFEGDEIRQQLRLLNVAGDYVIEAVVGRRRELDKHGLDASFATLDIAWSGLITARAKDEVERTTDMLGRLKTIIDGTLTRLREIADGEIK